MKNLILIENLVKYKFSIMEFTRKVNSHYFLIEPYEKADSHDENITQ